MCGSSQIRVTRGSLKFLLKREKKTEKNFKYKNKYRTQQTLLNLNKISSNTSNRKATKTNKKKEIKLPDPVTHKTKPTNKKFMFFIFAVFESFQKCEYLSHSVA